jgi:uncharacterized protein YjdB
MPFYQKNMRSLILAILFIVCFQFSSASDFFVSTLGNDATGNGSQTNPWRTLKFAVTKVPASQGHVIRLSAGTFVESGAVSVPLGVSIEGVGMDQTIIKAASSFYYNPTTPGFGTDKFLMNLTSSSSSNGNQSIKKLTIDGDGKKLHGGIFVQNRTNITVESVKVQYVNFSGIWFWDVKNSVLKDIKLKDCAWGSAGWCSGALQVANSANIDISGFDIDEGRGYGIKNLGQTTNTSFPNIKIHDGRVSVAPAGAWNNGSAPNITIEFWGSGFPGTEIYNCYLDNHVSLVTYPVAQRSTPLKIYNNIFDILGPRAKGAGYGLELSVYDVEVYNNWFNGGSTPIVNWGDRQFSNWNIHHNSVYGVASGYPTAVINSHKGGLKDVNIYNNTVEMSGTATVNFVEFNNGGVGENINIKNNLIINSNTSYAWYPNKLISLEKGAYVKNLQVSNNLLYNLPIGSVPGSYTNNQAVDPKITKTGSKPNPYYVPLAGSPLINAGVNVGLSFAGNTPTIGAHENSVSVIPVTGVIVAPSTVSLGIGATLQLTATVNPANASNKNITWSSNNTSIATVNSSGLIAAVASGTATITATTADGKKTNSSIVTVSSIPVTGASITPSTIPLNTGNTYQLIAGITPSNASNKNVTWISSNVGVATVNANGLVTAIGPGSSTITMTTNDGNKTSTALVAVNTNSQRSVDLDDGKKGSGINQFNYSGNSWTHGTNASSSYLYETVSYSNASTDYVTLSFAGNKIEFYAAKASHHGIAAVSVDNGPETYVDLYSATRQNFVAAYNSILTQGNHTIKIRVTGAKNVASTGAYVIVDYLKVYSSATTVPVAGIAIAPLTASLNSGSMLSLTTTISPGTATNKNITWISSDVKVATVTNTGVVTAVAGGIATITATSEDGVKTSTSVITVPAPVAGVSVTPAIVQLVASATAQLTATILPTNASNQNIKWNSSNPSVANVNVNGLVTALIPGSTTITLTVDGNKTATSAVTVSANTPFTYELDDAHKGSGINQFNYSGRAWTHGTNSSASYLYETVSYSNVVNNYTTLSFIGSKVEVYTSTASHHGIAAVSIDNSTETKVDLYSATRQNFSKVFSSDVLDEGTHTVKIRVTGTKNAASIGTYVVIDYLKVYSETAASVPTAVVINATDAAILAEAKLVAESTGQVQAFPNPVRSGNVLHVMLPVASGEVSIIDVTGFIHYTSMVTTTELEIPMTAIPKGMYFLQQRTAKGKVLLKLSVD